jgi:hypothetical protein
MRAHYERGLQWTRRNPFFLWLTIGVGLLVLVLGLVIVQVQSFYSSVYIHTPIGYQWACSDSRHCIVTIHNPGGGFDHGVNPAFRWAITGDPPASLHFSPTSGLLRANHSVQVQMVVAPGSCPTTITITGADNGNSPGEYETFNFSPFVYDPINSHCTLGTPSG